MLKLLIVVIILLILGALGSALYSLLVHKQGTNTVKALTLRIGLSLGLFGLLFVLYALGVIQPHAPF